MIEQGSFFKTDMFFELFRELTQQIDFIIILYDRSYQVSNSLMVSFSFLSHGIIFRQFAEKKIFFLPKMFFQVFLKTVNNILADPCRANIFYKPLPYFPNQ